MLNILKNEVVQENSREVVSEEIINEVIREREINGPNEVVHVRGIEGIKVINDDIREKILQNEKGNQVVEIILVHHRLLVRARQ